MNIRDQIHQVFPQSNLSAVDPEICAEFHLRFELGDGLKNGTVERVIQSVERASIIFKELFGDDDPTIVLAKTFEYSGDTKELFSNTPLYFENQFENFEESVKDVQSEFVQEFDEALHEDGVIRTTDFSINHKLAILETSVAKINVENIFKGIANKEMGFSPSITQIIWFVNLNKEVAFYMYDDRGCLLFSNNRDILKPLYHKYSSWLVNYDRETFNASFSDD